MARCFNGVRLLDHPSPANVRRLDLGCMPMVIDMMRNGILIDTGHMAQLAKKVITRKEEIESDIQLLAGWRINPASGDQVAKLLFDEMCLEVPGGAPKTPSGKRISTDEAVLSLLVSADPIVPLILDWRELDKLETTYVLPLPLMIWPDGRLRTTIRLTQARTGRMSSEDPNLQNIPIRTDLGNEVRNAFVARSGCKLVSNDLSQIEMLVAAHLSQDQKMLAIFRHGWDVHVKTACSIFRLEYDYITALAKAVKGGTATPEQQVEYAYFVKFHRLPAKTLGFGVLYGQTARGLQTGIASAGGPWWEETQCGEFILAWYEEYGGVAEWMGLQHMRARRYKMVWDMFGRTRAVPEVSSVLGGVINAGLREAGNTPIQGSAGGILKLAMAAAMLIVEHYRSYPGVVCDPLLPIHDEVITECSNDIAQDYANDMQQVMESAVELSAPVRSSSTIAERWGDLK